MGVFFLKQDKSFAFLLIKKVVAQLITKNRAKTDTTGAKPTRTQPGTSPNITQPRQSDHTKAGEKTP
jgi:hypothetical protein